MPETGSRPDASDEVVTKLSSRSVAETASLFTNLLSNKGLKIFSVIDQGAEARLVGLELRETILVIFGNPAGGTPVMAAAPLAALDLPLKVLIWADEGQGEGPGAGQGQTKVSYVSPEALARRHHLSAEVAANLKGIDALTDALVAR
jgi:uncharacterized protein (DUF302 family)